MKQIKEELHRRWKDHRQISSGNWSGLIIKIALLVMIIWLFFSFESGNDNFLKKFFPNKQTVQKQKESE